MERKATKKSENIELRGLHLILLRKRFKKLDKYSYTIDFSKEMMYISVRMRETSPLNEIKDKGVLQRKYLEKCLFLLERKKIRRKIC